MVMGERRISCKLKENEPTSCVTPAYINTLEALKEKQREKVEVCETSLVKIMVRVKRADQRRTDE